MIASLLLVLATASWGADLPTTFRAPENNSTEIGGVSISTGAGAADSGTQRVAIAGTVAVVSTGTQISGSVTVTPGTGTWDAGGSSVTAAQKGSYTVTPGTGSFTVQFTSGSFSNPLYTLSTNTVVSVAMSSGTGTFTTAVSSPAFVNTVNPYTKFAIQVVQTGVVTTWDARVEGSLDGTNFSQILSHTKAANGDGAVLWSGSVLSPSMYFRTNIASITLGIGISIKVTILGMQ